MTLPAEAYAAALAGLPGMGPKRLLAVLDRWPADEAWSRVLAGGAGVATDLGLAWRGAAQATDVAGLWQKHLDAGVSIDVLGGEGYPPVLAADHEAPALVFRLGDPSVLAGRRVAIVGTRRCTRYGRDVAQELGRDLAGAGVGVGVYYPRTVFDHDCYRDHPRVVVEEVPVAESVVRRCLSLPVHQHLTDAQLDTIVASLRRALGG